MHWSWIVDLRVNLFSKGLCSSSELCSAGKQRWVQQQGRHKRNNRRVNKKRAAEAWMKAVEHCLHVKGAHWTTSAGKEVQQATVWDEQGDKRGASGYLGLCCSATDGSSVRRE